MNITEEQLLTVYSCWSTSSSSLMRMFLCKLH